MKASWSATRKAIASITLVALATTGMAVAGSTAAHASSGPYTLRQTSFTDAQCDPRNTDAASWVAIGWIAPDSHYCHMFQKVLTAGTTTTVTYHVTDSNNQPATNTQIIVALGKGYSNSTAKDNFVNIGSNPGQGQLLGCDGANGNQTSGSKVSKDQCAAAYFTDGNGDINVQIHNNQILGSFDQVVAFVTDFHVDTTDVVDVVWTSTITPPATVKAFDFESGSGTPGYSNAYDDGSTSSFTMDTTTHKLGAKTSGHALKFVKGGQGYSGFDMISEQTSFIIAPYAAPKVKFDVFNAQPTTRNVLVELASGTDGASVSAYVQAPTGWSTQTIDFSTVTPNAGTYNGSMNYARLDFFPGFSDDPAASNKGSKDDVFYFDNVGINTVSCAVPTGKPTISSVTAGLGKVTVAYTAGTSAVAATTSTLSGCGYALSYQYSLGGTTWRYAPAPSASPFDISTLDDGKTALGNGYSATVKMRVVNGVGTSTTSATGTAVKTYSIPGAPTITTDTGGNGKVTIAFTAPAATSSGGAPLTYQYAVNAGAWTDLPGDKKTSPFIITGLGNGQTPSITMRAVNVVGNSAASVAKATGTTWNVPGAPTIGTTVAGNGQVTVPFTATTDANSGGTPVTKYQYSINAGSTWTDIPSLNNLTTPFIITGLGNGQTPSITMRAVNIIGNSVASAAKATATTFSTPGTPSITATAGTGKVTIKITAATNTGGTTATYYYSKDNGVTWVAAAVATNVDITVSKSTAVTVIAKATNVIGTSGNSASASATAK